MWRHGALRVVRELGGELVGSVSYEIGSDCGGLLLPGTERTVVGKGTNPAELLRAFAPCTEEVVDGQPAYRCGHAKKTLIEFVRICVSLEPDDFCAEVTAEPRSIRVTIADPARDE